MLVALTHISVQMLQNENVLVRTMKIFIVVGNDVINLLIINIMGVGLSHLHCIPYFFYTN